MANKRSALKAHRVSERKHDRNRAVISAVRTYVKNARIGIAGGPVEGAAPAVALAAKQLDMAAIKGVIHPNQAARRKSRLMRQLAVLAKAEPVTEAPAATPARRTRATGTTTRRPRAAAK